MRNIAVVTTVLVLVSGVASARPTRAAARLAAIEATSRRIDELVAQVKRDRDEVMIDVYRAYTDDQLRDRPQGGVTLDMLLEAVAEPMLAGDVRRRAAETIYMDRVVWNDPALDMNGRKGARERAGEEILAGLWSGRKKR